MKQIHKFIFLKFMRYWKMLDEWNEMVNDEANPRIHIFKIYAFKIYALDEWTEMVNDETNQQIHIFKIYTLLKDVGWMNWNG